MEAWYSAVRKLKDESDDPKLTRDCCFRIYHDLVFIKQNRKLKEKQKFRERKGVEFDSWTTELSEGYSSEMISEVISNNEFWNESLKVVSL
jgi:hypothetical protein